MSAAKHTPGPWRATAGSDGNFVTAGSTPITPLEWLKPEDAKLIAAATELLDVAKKLLADHQANEPHHAHLCEICKEAQEAINKAEGRK